MSSKACEMKDHLASTSIPSYFLFQIFLFLEAAVVKVGPSPMDVYKGQTVVVKCLASGDPIPKIR